MSMTWEDSLAEVVAEAMDAGASPAMVEDVVGRAIANWEPEE